MSTSSSCRTGNWGPKKVEIIEDAQERSQHAVPALPKSKENRVVAAGKKETGGEKDKEKEEEKNELFESFVKEISKEEANQIEIKGRRFNRATDVNKPENYSNYKNFAKYCSFWLKGECNRGEVCTYIHAEPPKIRRRNPKYDIKNRYLGVEDPDEKLSLRVFANRRECKRRARL